jgi:hypothetical protein
MVDKLLLQHHAKVYWNKRQKLFILMLNYSKDGISKWALKLNPLQLVSDCWTILIKTTAEFLLLAIQVTRSFWYYS